MVSQDKCYLNELNVYMRFRAPLVGTFNNRWFSAQLVRLDTLMYARIRPQLFLDRGKGIYSCIIGDHFMVKSYYVFLSSKHPQLASAYIAYFEMANGRILLWRSRDSGLGQKLIVPILDQNIGYLVFGDDEKNHSKNISTRARISLTPRTTPVKG